jgi:hypothetical protein
MVGHRIPLFELALLPSGQLPENLTEVTPQISIELSCDNSE